MKISRKVGATSQILQIFVQDSSSTTGAGLTGLVFNSGSLTAYYHKDIDTTATVIALVTMTVGTFTSSGFKEIDATRHRYNQTWNLCTRWSHKFCRYRCDRWWYWCWNDTDSRFYHQQH